MGFEPRAGLRATPPRPAAHGVWFRREATHKDRDNERHWSQEAFDALRSTACGDYQQPAADHEPRGSADSPTQPLPSPAAADGSCWLLARDPGRLSFREQAEMMKDAGMASGFEGSAFVNALFMPPGGGHRVVNRTLLETTIQLPLPLC